MNNNKKIVIFFGIWLAILSFSVVLASGIYFAPPFVMWGLFVVYVLSAIVLFYCYLKLERRVILFTSLGVLSYAGKHISGYLGLGMGENIFLYGIYLLIALGWWYAAFGGRNIRKEVAFGLGLAIFCFGLAGSFVELVLSPAIVWSFFLLSLVAASLMALFYLRVPRRVFIFASVGLLFYGIRFIPAYLQIEIWENIFTYGIYFSVAGGWWYAAFSGRRRNKEETG